MNLTDAQAWTVIIVSIGTMLTGLTVAIINAIDTRKVKVTTEEAKVQQVALMDVVQEVKVQSDGRLTRIEAELTEAKADLREALSTIRQQEGTRKDLAREAAAVLAAPVIVQP